MSLTVTVHLIGTGVYHGSDASGDLQWPPSPTRLLGAFIAATGTAAGCGADETGLSLMEHAGPPRIIASRPELLAEHHDNGLARYVAAHDPRRKPGASWLGLPGRAGTIARARRVAHPVHPRIDYVWQDAKPTHAELEALRHRAARIGYLGGSDSCVEVLVSDEAPEPDPDPRLGEWLPDGNGPVAIDVPAPGTVKAWDHHFVEQQRRGAAHQRGSVMALRNRCWYSASGTPSPISGYDGRVAVRIRFGTPVAPEMVLRVAETMRRQVLNAYQRHWGVLPAWIKGHANTGPVSIAPRFVPLPNVGFTRSDGRISDGRILGAMLLVPNTADDTESNRLVVVVRSLSRLRGRAVDIPVRPCRRGDPHTVSARRWSRPSRRWVSAWPVLLPRWYRRSESVTADDVATWCYHAGMEDGAEIVDLSLDRLPTLTGAVPLDHHRMNRRGRQPRPHSHVAITFDRHVAGPLILGAGASFGLGLMAPAEGIGER